VWETRALQDLGEVLLNMVTSKVAEEAMRWFLSTYLYAGGSPLFLSTYLCCYRSYLSTYLCAVRPGCSTQLNRHLASLLHVSTYLLCMTVKIFQSYPCSDTLAVLP
jgi:hypothetical protein